MNKGIHDLKTQGSILASALLLALGTPALAQDAGDQAQGPDHAGMDHQGEAGFSDWDSDGDGFISYQEWEEKFARHADMSKWDSDQDGLLSQEEYQDSLARIHPEMESDWDADGNGMLSQEELSRGLFRVHDSDNDNILEDSEFEKFSQAMADADFWSEDGSPA